MCERYAESCSPGREDAVGLSYWSLDSAQTLVVEFSYHIYAESHTDQDVYEGYC
jgi:hypothetical protein